MTKDEIRSKCRILGYSDPQIEGQIIPIMEIRNKLDGTIPSARESPRKP